MVPDGGARVKRSWLSPLGALSTPGEDGSLVSKLGGTELWHLHSPQLSSDSASQSPIHPQDADCHPEDLEAHSVWSCDGGRAGSVARDSSESPVEERQQDSSVFFWANNKSHVGTPRSLVSYPI
jgi:hypothetical protein